MGTARDILSTGSRTISTFDVPNPLAAPPGLRTAWREYLDNASAGGLTASVISFDEGAFDPRAFLFAGIACPLDVARSVNKRQAEFFFGRLAARHAMEAAGWAAADVPIGPNREPIWPTGLSGSISHSAGLAAAVVLADASSLRVGIDVERVIEPSLRETLRATVLDDREYHCVGACAGSQPQFDELMTIVFSAKESLFKATFAAVGRYFAFDAVRLVELDVARRHLVLQVRQSLCSSLAAGDRLDVYYAKLAHRVVMTSCVHAARP